MHTHVCVYIYIYIIYIYHECALFTIVCILFVFIQLIWNREIKQLKALIIINSGLILEVDHNNGTYSSQIWKVSSKYKLTRFLIDLLDVQYIPRNMHMVFALLCFVVVIHGLIFPYPSGSLHWHCGNLTIAPVPAKQPLWIWINTSWEFIMNDCITTTKQSTTKPCAYFLGYTVSPVSHVCNVEVKNPTW